jgi:single-strand DNA-binding protein
MAEGVNKAILIGNLGKDPDLSYTQSGTARCKFSLATSESYVTGAGERQDRTEWHNIIVWGKQAEVVAKFLQKGRKAYIEGRIQTRSWDDEKSGQKRYMTEINAQKVVFLGSRGEGGGGGGGGYQGSDNYQGGGQSGGGDSGQDGGSQAGPGPGGLGPDDDDIPF